MVRILSDNQDYKSGTKRVGVTTASYVTVFELTGFGRFTTGTIVIRETGGAQSLYYKVHVKETPQSTWAEDVSATGIAASGADLWYSTIPYHAVRVQVVNNSGVAAYEIGFAGESVS